MGNTTFNVVFLPRQQATIQAHLIIHTSFGVLNYEVKGKGVECPYRLSPLVGLKAPLNATLTPEIYMYNPFDTPLQIVEVYSSGGQFQLELPSSAADDQKAADGGAPGVSDYERSEAIWEIPPHCTKPVIRVRFAATAPGNQTAYIRIKVSAKKNAALEKAVIVLPIEVEIFKENGIYSSTPLLDFGIGGTNDRPKPFSLKLQNSGHDRIEVDAYTVEADSNIKNAISLDLETIRGRTPKDTTYHILRGTVDWSRVTVERVFRGHIVIHTRRRRADGKLHRSPYRIPFIGTVLHGAIQYNESLTRFHLTDDASQQSASLRDFRIRNSFDCALSITNLTVSPETQTYFRIDQFKPRVLQPGELATVFQLQQQPPAMKHSVTRSIHLHTNISQYDIEIFSFNGLLRRILPVNEQLDEYDTMDLSRHDIDERNIDFGILPLSTPSYITLALVNTNPIPINIHNWKGTVSSAAHVGITVPGCSKLTMKGLKFCNVVKPGEWILFQIGVESNTVDTFEGKFVVQTDYEVISTPIRFSTDMGVLKFTTKMTEPDKCFPVSGVFIVFLLLLCVWSKHTHFSMVFGVTPMCESIMCNITVYLRSEFNRASMY